jgi:hypothetical protein
VTAAGILRRNSDPTKLIDLVGIGKQLLITAARSPLFPLPTREIEPSARSRIDDQVGESRS